GSGLRVQRQGNGGYVLVPAGDGSAVELGATSVNGQWLGETTEHSGSYTTGVSRTATKLPLSIRETPQSVTVMCHEFRRKAKMHYLRRVESIHDQHKPTTQSLCRGIPG
ncbi:MAG: hypothetical protein KBB83_08470, partial [Alphaproteobacteria bacterium]|nr:hypothetical protein [Alphaproteobacteria bacterium]